MDLEAKPANLKNWFPVVKPKPLDQQPWEPLPAPVGR